MLKLILAGIIAAGLLCSGWVVLGTNIWGRPISDVVPPTNNQGLFYNATTKTWGYALPPYGGTGNVTVSIVGGGATVNGGSSVYGYDFSFNFPADQADAIASLRSIGAGAGQVVAGADARLTNKRAPTIPSETAGDTMYFDGSGWARVAKGTTGQLLQQGASAPFWVSAGPSGNVTVTPGANITVNGGTSPVYGSNFTLAATGVSGLTQYQVPMGSSTGSVTDSTLTVSGTLNTQYTVSNYNPAFTLENTFDLNQASFYLKNYGYRSLGGLVLTDASLGGQFNLRLFQRLAGASALRLQTGSNDPTNIGAPIEFFTGMDFSNWNDTAKRRMQLDSSGNVTVTLQDAGDRFAIADSTGARKLTVDPSGNVTAAGQVTGSNLPPMTGETGKFLNAAGGFSTPPSGGSGNVTITGTGITVNGGASAYGDDFILVVTSAPLTAHAASHRPGGTDTLSDTYAVTTRSLTAGTGLVGGGDFSVNRTLAVDSSAITPTWPNVQGKPTTFPPVIGSGAGDAVAGNDSRLTNARAPTAHAANHRPGGSDTLSDTFVVTTRSLSTDSYLSGGGDWSAQANG